MTTEAIEVDDTLRALIERVRSLRTADGRHIYAGFTAASAALAHAVADAPLVRVAQGERVEVAAMVAEAVAAERGRVAVMLESFANAACDVDAAMLRGALRSLRARLALRSPPAPTAPGRGDDEEEHEAQRRRDQTIGRASAYADSGRGSK